MKVKSSLLACGILLGSIAFSQVESESTGTAEQTEEDNLSNVQNYTPSKLLKKGQIDIQIFNNLYTQTGGRDADRNFISNDRRDTYFRSFAQVLVGTSKSGRVNWGFDAVFSSVRIDNNPGSSSLKVLSFEESTATRTAFSAIGPKIKFSPLKNHPDFSVQSALWFPIAKDSESDAFNKPWLDWNRITSWTQFFYSQQLNNKWQLFYEIDLLARFSLPASYYENDVKKDDLLSTPVSFFVNYFSNSKSTIYAMVQFAPTLGLSTDFSYNNDYFQGGLGGKYQLSKYLQLEALYTNFFSAKNNGAGRTYNIGLRYIR